jgi:3-hydroxybutyryl-CoA dehydrogenase
MNVAVIGAGRLGRDFALACVRAGHRVILEDVMPDKLRQVGVEFGLAGLAGTSDYEIELVATVEDAVRAADVVVDFVPDELESKLEIWSLIDRMAPPKTVMCTPSESLSITDLASCTYRGDRCVMVRGALSQGTVLRLLTAWATSEATRETALGLFRGLGHEVDAEDDPDLPMLLKNMHASML